MAFNDRLAARRAQQGPRPTSDAPNQSNGYEMQPPRPSGGGMNNFYAEITAIQADITAYNENVSRISNLHATSLNALDDSGAQQNAALLDDTRLETRNLANRIKDKIKQLVSEPASGQDAAIRKNQVGLVKKKFTEAVQRYQSVEQEFRNKYKQRVERQFKIVKPDATREEVSAVVNDESGGGQVFQQALSSSGRYQEGRAVQREVQERHQDILKMTETLTELAQLFNEVAMLVEQQDESINRIEVAAQDTEVDMKNADEQVQKAVKSARAARKKKWICFGIFVTILAIIAIVLAVYFTTRPKAASAPAAAA